MCGLKHTPGILQSSKISSQVLDPLMPSLSSFCAVENPGIPYKIHINTCRSKAASFNSRDPSSRHIVLYRIHSTKCKADPQDRQKHVNPPRLRQVNPEGEKNPSTLDLIYLFNNESCDASLMGLGICLCINNKDIGIWPVCDPELVAIQNIVVAWRKIKYKLSATKTELHCRIKILKTSVWIHVKLLK